MRHRPQPSRSRRRRRDHRGERGVLLVALLVGITVMMIMVTATAQGWTAIIKREREQELLFRGNQYVIALRAYQAEHGGQFPTDLEELMKEGPRGHRYIRQLFKDPFSEEGEWNLLFLGPDGKSAWNPNARPRVGGLPGVGGLNAAPAGFNQQGQVGQVNRSRGVSRQPGLGAQSGLGGQPGVAGQPGMNGQPGVPGSSPMGGPGVPGSMQSNVGPGLKRAGKSRFKSGNLNSPIVGVVSQGPDKGFQEYYMLQYYNEWEFHVFIQQVPQVQPGTVPGMNINPQGNIGPGGGLGIPKPGGGVNQNFGTGDGTQQQGGDRLKDLGGGN